ncbi:uncharacterized protein LOC120630789 isoform X1 [Pararge aegeria]|uniref:Jg3681 protein n=1 Tax=Pararge aegeria aegeria TaxID=348720 RepID=A0A8S4S2I0_9NEOP|nr:uncharacterized protein LOC120630789 isoform X1 [Pararge aegeria]CAH2246194.1 jg3681 [Pararge aegeria aegeria]
MPDGSVFCPRFLIPFTTNTIAHLAYKAFIIHVLMDPWGCQNINKSTVPEFEDNFKPEKSDKLADSAEYLAILERKLQKLKNKNKVVDNLAAYRADCIDRLMREGCDLDPVIGDTESEKLLQE